MAVKSPGERGIPYRSRPENQPVTVTRKTWTQLHERLDALERAVAELRGDPT